MGRPPHKSGIDIMRECLKKRGLDVRQVRRRMVHDRSVWWGFEEGMHGATIGAGGGRTLDFDNP